MIIAGQIGCRDFPCSDMDSHGYIVPEIDIDPNRVSIVMISECSPENLNDCYYAGDDSLFQKTTVQAFIDAGAQISNIKDIVDLGVYLTTAVKCRKTEYVIKAAAIKKCSEMLEKEIPLFPNIKVFMLMGDAAIKAVNYIAKRAGEKRPVPAGSTYKIRKNKYYFMGRRVFPSYLQAGPSFFIEKSKRRMIAEDISEAFHLASIKELCRVAVEVRVFPLLEPGAKTSRHLQPVMDSLTDEGYSATIVPVSYEFQRGGNKTLKIAAKRY